MKIPFWSARAARQTEAKAQFEDVLMRIVAAAEGMTPGMVTPENCMQAPTVKAIVTAVANRLSVTPLHIYERGTRNGREYKERLPDHPVARLLRQPNSWQSYYDFMQDAASTFIRWGRFVAFKTQGSTGPIRELIPLNPRAVVIRQNQETFALSYRVSEALGGQNEYPSRRIFHARGPSQDFFTGDSPVEQVKTAIALEILAERFGVQFFENGALPLIIFRFMQGSAGFKTKEQEKEFIDSYQDAFTGRRRFRSMLLPKGFEKPETIELDNEKAQFLGTRKYQRTVIAGAFGVPPHLVGDLERATFNNVEQQDQDFTLNVIMPVAQAFEAAIQRDLLTDNDRRSDIVARFNLDSVLRADFKSRQEGLWLQRQAGVIAANEWREIEGRNPLPAGNGGDDYLYPSNMNIAGEPIDEPQNEDTDDETDTDGPAAD